jgi:GMP synthase-like glutamine amidotransferase
VWFFNPLLRFYRVTPSPPPQLVWMSHGDEAVVLPEGFTAVAKSAQGAIVAVENPTKQVR